jgi:hypothetical protein
MPCARWELANEVVLLDIKEGFAEGKALDIWQTAPISLFDSRHHRQHERLHQDRQQRCGGDHQWPAPQTGHEPR